MKRSSLYYRSCKTAQIIKYFKIENFNRETL